MQPIVVYRAFNYKLWLHTIYNIHITEHTYSVMQTCDLSSCTVYIISWSESCRQVAFIWIMKHFKSKNLFYKSQQWAGFFWKSLLPTAESSAVVYRPEKGSIEMWAKGQCWSRTKKDFFPDKGQKCLNLLIVNFTFEGIKLINKWFLLNLLVS